MSLSDLVDYKNEINDFNYSQINNNQNNLNPIQKKEIQHYIGQVDNSYLHSINRSFILISIIIFAILFFILAKIKLLYPLYDFQKFAQYVGLGISTKELGKSSNTVINETANTLNYMKNKVNDLYQYQTKLLAGTVHDVQLPLTKMMLRKDMNLPENQKDKENILEVKALLENLILYTRDNWITMEQPQKTSMLEYMSHIIKEYEHPDIQISFKNNLEVKDSSPLIIIRPKALKRAIENVISNSLKYADLSITIQLSQNDKFIIISIIDDGEGIPDALKEDMFKPFFTAHHTTGHGIGLMVVKEIIDSHQGKIKVENGQHGGLNVSLYLPTS